MHSLLTLKPRTPLISEDAREIVVFYSQIKCSQGYVKIAVSNQSKKGIVIH